jgi:hypothetical protein
MSKNYQIKIEGHVGPHWEDWFEGMSVTSELDGTTLLSGPVADQSALHGLLKKVRDLGTPLISVLCVEPTLPMPIAQPHQNHSIEGVNMTTTVNKMDAMKTRLSTLWLFAILNYLYCDIVSLMDSGLLQQYLKGNVGGMQINQGFLLGASILMEIPIAMVLLSRLLGHKANRPANIIAGSIMTIVQVLTLFVGTAPANYYVFFSVIEIACTALIVWLAWKWVNPEPNQVN